MSILDLKGTPQQQEEDQVKQEVTYKTMKAFTLPQLEQWIDKNVNTVEDVRRVFKIFAKIIIKVILPKLRDV